ncbi:hypothetical protein AMECASPLE_007009 [Ameca splendens]|uniref:Uncharacterized protein n=1 Tax=Ameca splendens TaxID=208324 RepID=A0ABV0YY92_9TELE
MPYTIMRNTVYLTVVRQTASTRPQRITAKEAVSKYIDEKLSGRTKFGRKRFTSKMDDHRQSPLRVWRIFTIGLLLESVLQEPAHIDGFTKWTTADTFPVLSHS